MGALCKARNVDGSPCKVAFSLQDDGRCWQHSPLVERERTESRIKGGEESAKARAVRGIDTDDLPYLDGPQAAAIWLDVIGRAVATLDLGPTAATAIVRVIEAFLKAHDAGDMREDIRALRDALRIWKKTGDSAPLLELVK